MFPFKSAVGLLLLAVNVYGYSVSTLEISYNSKTCAATTRGYSTLGAGNVCLVSSNNESSYMFDCDRDLYKHFTDVDCTTQQLSLTTSTCLAGSEDSNRMICEDFDEENVIQWEIGASCSEEDAPDFSNIVVVLGRCYVSSPAVPLSLKSFRITINEDQTVTLRVYSGTFCTGEVDDEIGSDLDTCTETDAFSVDSPATGNGIRFSPVAPGVIMSNPATETPTDDSGSTLSPASSNAPTSSVALVSIHKLVGIVILVIATFIVY